VKRRRGDGLLPYRWEGEKAKVRTAFGSRGGQRCRSLSKVKRGGAGLNSPRIWYGAKPQEREKKGQGGPNTTLLTVPA